MLGAKHPNVSNNMFSLHEQFITDNLNDITSKLSALNQQSANGSLSNTDYAKQYKQILYDGLYKHVEDIANQFINQGFIHPEVK